MRQAAVVVGVVWIVACIALWLWIGFFWDFDPIATWPALSNWSVVSLLADSKLGLTFVPILLAIPGAGLIKWGSGSGSNAP
jgi:hypothetical protein